MSKVSIKDKYDITEKLFEKLPVKENKDYEVVDRLPENKKKKGKKASNALLKMVGEE